MSANTPDSVPTSADSRSHRPTKRRALSPASKQSAHLESLFANPSRALGLVNDSIPFNQNHGSNLPPPPEIVTNVQGSSAGAGSGEFHVYKASRRREYERLRAMDEEVAGDEMRREHEARREEARRLDEEKTERNRAKREKARARKMKGRVGGGGGGGDGDGLNGPNGDGSSGTGAGAAKVKPRTNHVPAAATRSAEDADGAGDAQADIAVSEEQGMVIHDED